MQCVS